MQDIRRELDYLFVLKALDEIPFRVGRKLLIEFLLGKENNKSISRNRLYTMKNFATLDYDKKGLNRMVGNLILNDMIQETSLDNNRFVKLLELSVKGRNEINNPGLYKRKLSFSFNNVETVITDKEKKLFETFSNFLSKFNDEQKKSIINTDKHILCIAGAGSGKTIVLTKRIEFLIKYKNIDPSKILAITFTRKARQEMMTRISKVKQASGVMVETFNSFCEKILKKHNDLIYNKPVRVISYGDKVRIINKALDKLNMDIADAVSVYFSPAQKRGKTEEQLAHIFLNDCFFIRDYFKFKNKSIREPFFEVVDKEHEKSATMIFSICNYIEAYMKKQGLRDFADQLIDTINFFEEHKDIIPEFDHVLIDEYQDINSTQIKFIELLSPENLFCVGDPRQSIYGWRGSDIKYILSFKDIYPNCEIITLTKNYRSTKHIVELINTSIKNMKLADLKADLEGEKNIELLGFDSEDVELEFVIQRILSSELPRNEIFVLARTNSQLNDLSEKMKARKIKHVVKSDEIKKSVFVENNDVTLATIHAIKGLEAGMVFVLGCTNNNFPCKGSEHPVIEMVKMDEYDKEEEEQRLLYVAMSRAKKRLYLTYSGKKPTYFITDEMREIIDPKLKNQNFKRKEVNATLLKENKINEDVLERLREWRRALSKEHSLPAYCIVNNRALVELAEKMPKTFIELKEINGIGPAKLEKYGEEILRIVNG